MPVVKDGIIPYQQLIGNYNLREALDRVGEIIPYQQLIGNYNATGNYVNAYTIIPYQ